METDTTIPDQLTWIWDQKVSDLFGFQEDEEIRVQKAFCDASSKLSGTPWGKIGRRAVHTNREPFLTRSMEPYRRFLGKVIRALPEPFKLPSDLVAKVLGVTKGQASKVVKWWVGYGLIEVVEKSKPGQPSTYRRKLLQ